MQNVTKPLALRPKVYYQKQLKMHAVIKGSVFLGNDKAIPSFSPWCNRYTTFFASIYIVWLCVTRKENSDLAEHKKPSSTITLLYLIIMNVL